MKRLIFSSIHLMLIRATGVLVQFGNILFIARSLPIEDMGVFATVYAYLGLVRFLGPLGSDQIALKRIAAEGGGNISTDVIRISAAGLTLTLWVSLIITGASALFLRSYGLSDAEILSICLSIPAFALMGSYIGQIRGLGRNLSAQMPEALGTHLLLAIFLGLATWSDSVSRESILLLLCVSAWCVVGVYFAIMRRIGIPGISLAPLREVSRMARDGLSIFQALLFTSVGVRAPVFIAAFLGGAAAAALMDIAVRFGSLATLTTSSISATFSPYYARMASEADRKGLHKTMSIASILATLPAVGWLILVAVGGGYVVNGLLPSDYAAAIAPMTFIAIAYAINAAMGQSGTVLFMSGAAQVVSWLSLVKIMVIIMISLALYPSLGITSVACALALGLLARDGGGMAYVIMRHDLSQRTNKKSN